MKKWDKIFAFLDLAFEFISHAFVLVFAFLTFGSLSYAHLIPLAITFDLRAIHFLLKNKHHHFYINILIIISLIGQLIQVYFKDLYNIIYK